MPKDSSEFFARKQYHIGASPGDLAEYILLCGDPERARKVAERFDPGTISFTGSHREFVIFTGKYEGVPVSVMATGIGTDNTEIAVIEAAQCVDSPTFIRIGSCGAIKNGIKLGDLVISRDAIPRENTSSFYLPPGTRVKANAQVTSALIAVAESLGHIYHVGTTCSTSSFYGGQCREVPGFPIRENAKSRHVFPRLLRRGVVNFEMESSLLFTLARISTLGIRAGAVCAVYAERQAKKGFSQKDIVIAEKRCIEVGLKSITLLAAETVP